MPKPPRIQVPLDLILKSRNRQIISLFSSLARKQGKIVVNTVNIGGDVILAVSDIFETGSDYRDWRFKTKVENFNAMYYERWLPYEKNIYYLDRTYFHLYKIDYVSTSSQEFICLHCDANEPDNAEHALFKQSPHLHFSFADQPIPHSHIALNNGNLSAILTSIETLHRALKLAVDMIYTEILLPIKAHNEN